MHGATVALSEHYRAVLADHLTQELGVQWEQHARGRDRNPDWEVTGVPDRLRIRAGRTAPGRAGPTL